MSINLCRICLENRAHLPIFSNEESVLNIQDKLSTCLKEKIEDQEGYPRYICEVCNNILDLLYKFVNKYKETSKTLERGLGIVKEENENDYIYNDVTDEEIPIPFIKKEDELKSNEFEIKKHHEPLKKELCVKLERIEIPLKKKYSGKRCLEVSNKIASSILEGEFIWNGSEWCLSSKSIKSKVKQVTTTNNCRRTVKIPIPKIKKPNPPKLCDLCGEVFKSHEKLTVHKKRAHNGKHYQCKLCSRMFNSSYDLKRHVLRRHEKERNFVCDICGRGFAFNGELTSHHKNVHEKHLKIKKSFKCKFCTKSYKCSKSVVIHERSAHTGYRPAVCTICDSSFFHEDYLKEHMRLHTGETPFKCPICKRGYAQRGNMKSHLRIHKKSELDEDTLSKLKPNYLKLLKA